LIIKLLNKKLPHPWGSFDLARWTVHSLKIAKLLMPWRNQQENRPQAAESKDTTCLIAGLSLFQHHRAPIANTRLALSDIPKFQYDLFKGLPDLILAQALHFESDQVGIYTTPGEHAK
jgi:hypothetical protein